MKKNVILSLTIILAFLLPQMISAQKANFAGTWTFNAEKSTPAPTGGGGGGGGGRGGFGGGNFVAKQDASTLTRTTTRTGQDGTPTTRSTVYTLDGKENTLAAPQGGGGGGGNASPAKYTATWSADGKTLTIVTTRTFNDTQMKTTEAWTLTNPKTLTIVSTGMGRDGTPTTRTQVYEQK